MIQCLLRDVVVVQPTVAFQRLFQVFTGFIPPGRQHVADAAVEALDHPIGLWPPWLDKSMLDAMRLALPIEGVTITRLPLSRPCEAIGE